MKFIRLILITIVLSFSSCSNKKLNECTVTIDLNNVVPDIPYSLFVDSLNYLTLDLGDSLIMSGIHRLYVDGDYILVEDYKLGLFVFSAKEGSLVKNINYFGDGPEEFNRIRTFTFDPQKQLVIVYSYPFLKKYTYEGEFVESIQSIDNNSVELYHTNTGEYICITPEESGPNQPCGVWLVDSTFQYIKHLKEIPSDQKLFTSSQFYNWTENGIYYYDRVWDDFSFITNDSVEMLYKFDFKQRVPAKMRDREHPFETFSEYSMINEFANSDRYILLSYYNMATYNLTWVLLDKKSNEVICSTQLRNDMSVEETPNRLFYINDQTWCRVLEFEEESSTVTLEFMYVKR